MPSYKLKRGVTIGSLAAENDTMLYDVFVDSGYVDRLCSPVDPAFLILGRAGSGKTALIRKMEELQGLRLVKIDPEELSMQYLQNSVLREISTWGVNLEIFYKYLWRHVCILALARARFVDARAVPTKLKGFAGFREILFGDDTRREVEQSSKSYLEEYADQFWIGTDTKVQKITAEIEGELKTDRSIAAHLGASKAGIDAKAGSQNSQKSSSKIEQETVARAQQIVSRFQIADLNRLVDLITKEAFDDPQNPFILVIDDLDKNWMPDDVLYLELCKSLLLVVRELNYRLVNAKIVVALREDIYQRVYERTAKHEAQREKWADVQIKVRWSKEQLVEMVDLRLAKIYRGQYTQQPPRLEDLLPAKRRKPKEEDAADYLIDRTLMRPRDVIDFINRCLAESHEVSKLTWGDLRAAEVGYSEARLNAIVDEWANCYFGLPATFALLSKLGERFTPRDITDDDILEIFLDDVTAQCDWLTKAAQKYAHGEVGILEAKKDILHGWFNVGLVGIKDPTSHRTLMSLDRAFIPSKDVDDDRDYVTLKIVRSALGIAVQNKLMELD